MSGRLAQCIRVAVAACCALAAFALAGTNAAHAQAGEQIDRFVADVTIRDDGTLVVVERITYRFPPGEARRGILRELPVEYRYDGDHDRHVPIEVLSVSSPTGAPAQFTTSREGAALRIRIGDPDRTIRGVHDYELMYEVRGALSAFADHDELFWNVTGGGWNVPIADARVRVHSPAPIDRAACFAGATGSQLPCRAVVVDGDLVRALSSPLFAGGELSVVVALPKGAVPEPRPILVERWTLSRAFTRSASTVGLTALLTIGLAAALAATVWRVGRDRRAIGAPVDVAFSDGTGAAQPVELFDDTPTPVEFVPPDDLRPGQIGTLVDEVANPLDVTATIVDLAVRGHLRIDEREKGWWFGKGDWDLVRLHEDTTGLLAYERLLLERLFASGSTVALSSLKRTFHDDLAQVQRALYDDVVARGWFRHRPDHIRTWWTTIGIGVAIAGGVIVYLLARHTTYALVGLPLPIAGLALAALARFMPSRTAKGTAARRRALGFRRFISESERDRAQFAERTQLFTEYLPYAIVFGATEQWARAFAGLAAAPPSWYVGSRPFVFADFSRTIDGFSDTTVGTIRSTPAGSGSSGFSGGGAGGGVGGGGGGSW
ncbi:MAG TPA: DUF2207 domain-containing protein [Acidimicrobiia bacterium]|nr:DUF2207 domain-containing protein [Acidimicrobiia bacterium]